MRIWNQLGIVVFQVSAHEPHARGGDHDLHSLRQAELIPASQWVHRQADSRD